MEPQAFKVVLYATRVTLALFITLALVPLVRHYALAAGFMDKPDERKIHKEPIPRLGGFALWAGFMLTLWIMFHQTPMGYSLIGIMLGGTIMFMLGLVDDLVTLSPYLKLAVQFIAALLAYDFHVQIITLDLPGSKLIVLNALSLPITVLWLVGFSNALNFIDGIDGLAAGVVSIAALTMVVVGVFTGKPTEALLAAMLAGAAMGFLAYNFHPAKIFMGDSGSLFCGFMLAALAVTGALKTKVVVMLLPLFVLCVPLMDISYAVLRRLFKGKNPFLPDSEHIHHQFLKLGMSQTRAVFYFYGFCVAGGVIATWYLNYQWAYLGLIIGQFTLGALLILGVRKFFPLTSLPATPKNKN